MKKIILTFALALMLSLSLMLASCTGNMTEENTTGASSGTTTETSKEEQTTNNIIDDAESKMEDMSEDATHGVEDGTPGGHSSRGGRHTLIPRGK